MPDFDQNFSGVPPQDPAAGGATLSLSLQPILCEPNIFDASALLRYTLPVYMCHSV